MRTPRLVTAVLTAVPLLVAIPAATAGSARLVVNWRMMIDPDPARSFAGPLVHPPDAGLTNR